MPSPSQATASPSSRNERTWSAPAASAIRGYRSAQSCPLRVSSRTPAGSRRTISRNPSCLISCSHRPPEGSVSALVEEARLDEAGLEYSYAIWRGLGEWTPGCESPWQKRHTAAKLTMQASPVAKHARPRMAAWQATYGARLYPNPCRSRPPERPPPLPRSAAGLFLELQSPDQQGWPRLRSVGVSRA